MDANSGSAMPCTRLGVVSRMHPSFLHSSLMPAPPTMSTMDAKTGWRFALCSGYDNSLATGADSMRREESVNFAKWRPDVRDQYKKGGQKNAFWHAVLSPASRPANRGLCQAGDVPTSVRAALGARSSDP